MFPDRTSKSEFLNTCIIVAHNKFKNNGKYYILMGNINLKIIKKNISLKNIQYFNEKFVNDLCDINYQYVATFLINWLDNDNNDKCRQHFTYF